MSIKVCKPPCPHPLHSLPSPIPRKPIFDIYLKHPRDNFHDDLSISPLRMSHSHINSIKVPCPRAQSQIRFPLLLANHTYIASRNDLHQGNPAFAEFAVAAPDFNE